MKTLTKRESLYYGMKYRNILIIDDDVDDQEIFLAAVSEVSDSVVCNSSTNASEALEKLSVNQLNPDVIFLDLNMPVMSGKEFLVAIKENSHLSTIPVIIFSTTSQPTTVKAMKELGAIDFITKPQRYNELVDILKPLLA